MQVVVEKAIEIFGQEHQIRMAQEELAELITALNHKLRGRKANVDEEMADVMITIKQLFLIFDNENKVQKHIDKKIKRLSEILAEKKSK